LLKVRGLEFRLFYPKPRYHQSRLVRRVAEDITTHFLAHGDIGKKYLADHSAGSGKTLSICWLADRLHSLFKPGTSEKLARRSSICWPVSSSAIISSPASSPIRRKYRSLLSLLNGSARSSSKPGPYPT